MLNRFFLILILISKLSLSSCQSKETQDSVFNFEDDFNFIIVDEVNKNADSLFIHYNSDAELISNLDSMYNVYGLTKKTNKDSGSICAITFVVNEDGSLSDFIILKSVNHESDSLFLELSKNLKFTPAYHAGTNKNIKQRVVTPFRF